jgi:hypothetical protein
MATIKTDSPSTGKSISIFTNNISKDASNATVIWEANDFLVPLREEGEGIIIIESEGEERQLVDGEALFITPLSISNSGDVGHYLWVLVQNNGTEYEYVSRVYIPGGDTVQIGINGFSLIKNTPDREENALGPQLKVYARRADDLNNENNVEIFLTLVTTITEQEAGSHAPAFQGIF